ncbi:SMI1/KNR4 family protein [Paenibacillus lemnae]|uniref:SMI1/KNR4 family protein n=1 Tax=Paenibacillus lemnae TaxID=1330551 RepID=A0A848M0I1_PAELE|nr:SMI1/KNR4 family protein [Paenibacillus lemnae]NMO94327.1 SMI1/KNR4 family protein [Paenibacillus lemnae]
MTKDEIELILKSLLDKEDIEYNPPSINDWRELERKFSCVIGEDFKLFIDLMSKYSFPGDILNVSTGLTNSNDTISFTYDFEMNQGGKWKPEMIPFYSIGNGDYFCLNSIESPDSPVYYYYHEDFYFEEYTENFALWIKALPEFLS